MQHISLDYGGGVTVSITKQRDKDDIQIMVHGPGDNQTYWNHAEPVSKYELVQDWQRANRIERVVTDPNHDVIRMVNYWAEAWQQAAIAAD